MDCAQARDLLSEYQDGTLDSAAEGALAAHLRACGECAGCAGSLLAVRELLRGLTPVPAPPELFERVVAAVAAENRHTGAEAARSNLSRFRIPLEAAAVVLLFASVYWYQRTAPAPGPPPAPHSSAPAAQPSGTQPPGTQAPAIRPPRGNPPTARGTGPAAAKPRAWTAADLPSAPALFASTNSERIIPVAPSPKSTDPPPSRVVAAPPSRLLRPPPYGRDIVVDVDTESLEGAEERIAEAASRVGGIVERIEHGRAGAATGVAGSVHVVLPAPAAERFLEEMERIGTIPREGKPAATDLPSGPRAGTVAYAVRIRVR